MNIDIQFPKFDIPVEFLAADDLYGQILNFYSYYPCKIKSCIFVLIKKGEVKVTVNRSKYHLKKGDLISLLPETFIQVHELIGEVTLSYAAFSYTFIRESNLFNPDMDYLLIIRNNPVLKLEEDMYHFFENYYRLLSEGQEKEVLIFNRNIHVSILTIILEHISELYKKQFNWEDRKHNRDWAILMKFLSLLNEHYKQEHRASFYAKRIGITLQHLCKTIKQASEKTPLEIISETLILEAKSLLKSTSVPVKQIAMSLGFRNTAFFYKFFKQHVGVTPQEYRES